MSIEEIALEAEERMEKSVSLLGDQLRGIRTGRANVGLVESIRVEYYGSPTPLKQMANLSTPEPQQILIRPFDPTVIGDIVKAIQTSDLGLIAELRRQGGAAQRAAALRRAAQEASQPRQGTGRGSPGVDPQHPPRRQQTGGSSSKPTKILTEDDLATCKEEIQNLTKQFEAKVNEVADKKSAEIMEV